MMAPILDDLSEELTGKARIAKLDVENPKNQNLAAQYSIQSIPNMKLFKGGKVAKDFVGFRPKDAFKAELEAEL